MYCKGGNKTGLNSGDTSWRSYSKSLIIELKEKLADRRARTLALLSENGDLAAFNEIDTESDGLEDTSTNVTNNEDLPAKDEAMQNGQGGEMNSLSDTSSLTESDYNDVDIRHDGPKHSPGTSNCVNSRCCSRSCSTITSVSGRSYTSEDVSSRSLDDFVADAGLVNGIKERNHPCPHSVDVRCSLCLIETKIQEKYFSQDVAPGQEYQLVSHQRIGAHRSQALPTSSLYCKDMGIPVSGFQERNMKTKSDTCLCVALQSVAGHVDSHSTSAGVLITPTLTGTRYAAIDGQRKTSPSSLNSLSHLELENPSQSFDKLSANLQTISNEQGKENTDSLHDYYLQVEEEGEDEDFFLEDVTSDEEEKEAVSEKYSVEVVGDDKEEAVSKTDIESDIEVNKERIAELEIEGNDGDKGGAWTEENEEEERRTLVQKKQQRADDEKYDEQHPADDEICEEQQPADDELCEEQQPADDEICEEQRPSSDEICEEQQRNEVEGKRVVNELIRGYKNPQEFTPQTDLECHNMLNASAMTNVTHEGITLSKGLSSSESDIIKHDALHDQTYTPLGIQETDHRSFSHMKNTLNELVRIFESNAEFYNAVNKSIAGRFQHHFADFNMLFSAYENKSGNSGYIQNSKSGSSAPDPEAQGGSSDPADVATKLNEQNRSLQACLEKARLANTLQGKVGQMRSMATNVAAIKAYEQTIADLEKTMMDYLQVYATEAIGSVSGNLSKLQPTSGIPDGSSQDIASENKTNVLHRSGTFVLKETCAAKPPNIAKRKDNSLSMATGLLVKSKTFNTDVEEGADASRSEESQNGPHPSPTFLVTEDSKNMPDSFVEIPEHSQTETNSPAGDSGVNRKLKKPQQTMKGPSCLISDQDFDSDTSDSLSEVKETGNLTYTSSLLTQLLDYNSADECKTIREAKLDEGIDFAGMDFENNQPAFSEFLDSSPGSSKQQTSSKSKNSRNVKMNPICKKTVASNILTKSRWLSVNGDDHDFEAFDYMSDLDKDIKDVDTPCISHLSESAKVVSKHIPHQERGRMVQPEARNESIRNLAEMNDLSQVTDNRHSNTEVISKSVTGSSRQDLSNLSETLSPAVDRRVNKQAKSLLENELQEEVANQTSCSKANETPATSKQLSGRSSKQYFLGQQSHKQWQLPKEDAEDMSENPKQDMLLAKLDWSSSDDEAVDDVPRDVSPSNLLRQKQKRDVDDQLEHLNEFYRRTRKSRSPLRRTASSNISRWIDNVQCASTAYAPTEAPDFFADTFPLRFRPDHYDALSGQADNDACTSKYFNIDEDSENAVFVSPSQLLEARNQEETNVNEDGELNEKWNEQIQTTDTLMRSTVFKEDHTEILSHQEGSKRSLSMSSTSDEYVLSDTCSIQVNTSRDNLMCVVPEDIDIMPDVSNVELAQTQTSNLTNASFVEVCVPKVRLAVSDSSCTARVSQSNTDTYDIHQTELAISIDNQSLYQMKAISGQQDKDDSPDKLAVPESPLLTGFTTIDQIRVDFPYQNNGLVCSKETLRGAEIQPAARADPIGDGINNGVLHSYRTNKFHPEEQQITDSDSLCAHTNQPGSDSLCAHTNQPGSAFEDEQHAEGARDKQYTMQASQTWTLGKELNKHMKNNGRPYCDSTPGETCREERTDVSAIRERWKLLEDGRNVATLTEPERKQPSKKIIHHFKDQSVCPSMNKTLAENVSCDSAGKNFLPAGRENNGKASFHKTPSPYALADEDEQCKWQGGALLTEYQAIDALRYKVYRLEQMLQQSDINTANFHKRNVSVRADDTLATSDQLTRCPHCQHGGSAHRLTRTRFQSRPELDRGSHPCSLGNINDREYFQESQNWDVCQVCLSGHGSCVHLQGEALSRDKKFHKHCMNVSSKACQTADDMTTGNLKSKTDSHVDVCTQYHTSEDTTEAVLTPLEQQVSIIHEGMQEIKHVASSANTLMSELDERVKSFAALTSTTLATHSRQLENSQTFISEELSHVQESLRAQNDIYKLVREYVAVAEQNSETVLQTVKSQHQDLISRTAQAVEETTAPMKESLIAQKKEIEDLKSSLERIMSRIEDKRPENSKKALNHELMKERIVELTSQRDAEKVFHRITRQALRALEKDHDRLRQEYVRATCRRYNTNESEAQKRLWYYLNNEDKCPHNKNHSNVRATPPLHEVWLPRGSSTDGDASSTCSRHGSCAYVHMSDVECFRLPQCGCAVADNGKGWEFTSRRKDNTDMCKNTNILKCASKTSTYLPRSADSHENEELCGRHNLTPVHVMKSPKKVKEIQRSGSVEQHLGVRSTAHELSACLPQAIRAETSRDVNVLTQTMNTDKFLDKCAGTSTEDSDIDCKCPCPGGNKYT